jgi:hypothetical protein
MINEFEYGHHQQQVMDAGYEGGLLVIGAASLLTTP